MAILVNGILGGFIGRLGNVTGYRYKGQYCIRLLPAKGEHKPSPAQKAQQAKFAMTMAFLKPLAPLFQQMPDQGKRRISAFSHTFGAILKNRVKGSYPDYSIDYQGLQFSSGSLHPGWCPQVLAEPKALQFRACLREPVKEDLRVVLLAYNENKESWIYQVRPAAELNSGISLKLPCDFRGDKLQTWMFMSTADFKRQSPTLYTGAYTIPGHVSCSFSN